MAKAKSFDAAEYLDSPEMVAAYLTEAFEIRRSVRNNDGNRRRSPLSGHGRHCRKGRSIP